MTDDVLTMVSAREVPWHRKGVVTPGAMTAKEAAELGGLDFTVDMVPCMTPSGVVVPRKNITVRTDTDTPLGVVGDRYRVAQNSEVFDVLDHIVDSTGAHYETAGVLGRGERVFMSLRFPEGINVAGEDPHDLYLLAHNSHNGSTALNLATTVVRAVCANTVSAGLRVAKTTFNIRHTDQMEGRVQEAREALQVTFDYVDDFTRDMERLLEQTVSDEQWERVVNGLIPLSEESQSGWKDRTRAMQDRLNTLFYEAETQTFGRGTAYAAYNAVVEYADWALPVKGADPNGDKRAERALTSPIPSNFKQKGLALIRA